MNNMITEGEKEKFQRCATILLTETFLIRSLEQHAKSYRYGIQNFNRLEEYFTMAGWRLKKDETLGIIALEGPAAARVSLNLEETLSLLIIRLFYEEKSREVTLHGERTILQQDFVERYRAMTERPLNKTSLTFIFRKLQSMRLIRVLGDESDPETAIILYPSIPFALEAVSIDEVHQRIELFNKNTGGETEEETEEEDEER
jgi:hypothetical protein